MNVGLKNSCSFQLVLTCKIIHIFTSIKEPYIIFLVKFIRIIFISVSVIVFSGLEGCVRSGLKNLDEGEIHYSIKYYGNHGSVSEAMLPDNMIVKFKNNRIMMEIMTPIGNNGIINIIDYENNTMETYLRLIGMKYVYRGVAGEIPPGIDPMSSLIIEKTSSTREFFGLQCNHARATLPETEFTYDLWYTAEIELRNPNLSTPFSSIDGVMIMFFYKMGDMIVEFEAQGVYKRSLPEKEFTPGSKYRDLDRTTMHSIISKMMNL